MFSRWLMKTMMLITTNSAAIAAWLRDKAAIGTTTAAVSADSEEIAEQEGHRQPDDAKISATCQAGRSARRDRWRRPCRP